MADIESGAPAISAVVATHNRATLLPRLIDAFAAQTCERFEVIVVDDASTDGTWAALQRLASGASFPLRALRLDRNRGAAAARNEGWRAARAPLIAFTDDDCVPDPRWLDRMTAALEDHDLVQGRTEANPDHQARIGPFSRWIAISHEDGFYATCNMGYRRDVVARVAGFDEGFVLPYGEDCDLAWRVKDAGGRSTFAADAVVYHDVWPSDYRAYLRDKVRRDGLVQALKKHPRLRAQRGVFHNATHATALIAAAAASALVTRPGKTTLAAAVGAGAAYAWNCGRHHGGPARGLPVRRLHWAYLVPMHLLADLYEIAILARASVKYRTLVL